MNEPYFDGDFTKPEMVGPALPWRDARTRALMATSTWWVRKDNWRSIERGTVIDDIPGIVVAESETRCVGADVLEYELTHSEIPKPWTEFEPWVYNFQYLISGQVTELAVSLTSRVRYSYYNTVDPSGIALRKAYRFAASGGATPRLIGERPRDYSWILAENEQINRWEGDIWQKTTREIFYDLRKFLTT